VFDTSGAAGAGVIVVNRSEIGVRDGRWNTEFAQAPHDTTTAGTAIADIVKSLTIIAGGVDQSFFLGRF